MGLATLYIDNSYGFLVTGYSPKRTLVMARYGNPDAVPFAKQDRGRLKADDELRHLARI